MKREIPEMTHPLSKHWSQPNKKDILVDDYHAVMTKETFEQLNEYSNSRPSGVYPGKMWKAYWPDIWVLRWFVLDPKNNEMCIIHSVKILFV